MKVTFRIENKRLCKALEKGTRKVLLEVGYHGGSDEAKKSCLSPVPLIPSMICLWNGLLLY